MKQQNNRLLILSKDAERYLELIKRGKLPNLTMVTSSDVEEAKSLCAECDIIFGEPGLIRHVLPYASQLQWLQSTWAGITTLLGAGDRHDYQLTGVKEVFGPQMSEYVFCYMLMHERQVWARYQSQLERQWEQTASGTLQRKVIGILGVGSIGAHLAQTAKYFGMRTKGYTRRSTSCEWIDEYYHGDLVEFVADLDYLVSVLPNTSDTEHMINQTVLSAMKSSAILINVGRGNAIDESALIDALNEQKIAGAVLDVFQQEPLPETHPFWSTPNVTITSHTSALSFPEDIAPIFIDNYRRFIKGDPLNYQIDFERGY